MKSMKSMKKVVSFLLAFLLVLGCSLPVSAVEKTTEKEEEYVTNSKGIKVKKTLLCDNPKCLEEHVGKTLSIAELPLSDGEEEYLASEQYEKEKLLSNVYVGMVVKGNDVRVAFWGTPGTAGAHEFVVYDGALAGVKGNAWCINHGAANPGEGYWQTCSYSAECKDIQGNQAEWHITITPPGAWDGQSYHNGLPAGYQRLGVRIKVPFEEPRGDVEILKYKKVKDEKKVYLEGIRFTFTSKKTGKVVADLVTDKKGWGSTHDKKSGKGGLPVDTYIVEEDVQTIPTGLEKANAFEVTISKQNEILKYEVENKEIMAPVKLVKVDRTTGKTIPLANAEFQLLDQDKKVITLTDNQTAEMKQTVFKTDSTGAFTLPERIPYGTYYFRELKAPEGYVLRTEDIPFEVKEMLDWEKPIIVSVKNDPSMGKIQIVKKDSVTGTYLDGVTFQIYAAEDIMTPDGTLRLKKGELADEVKTKEGIAETKKLYLGKYEVIESKTIPGYVRNEKKYDIELKYKNQHTKVVTETISVENHPTTIVLKKVQKGTEEPLAGVTFQVWNTRLSDARLDESMKKEYVTDQKGTIILKYLKPGEYCIQETKTLPGYVLDDTIHEISIDENGKIAGLKEQEPSEKATIFLENDYTKVEISKQARDTGKELPGAELKLIRKDTKEVVEKWVSKEKPHEIHALEPGIYILREVQAPKGYKLASDVSFTVEEHGNVQKVVMKDEKFEKIIQPKQPDQIEKNEHKPPKTGDDLTISILLILAISSILVLFFSLLYYLFSFRKKWSILIYKHRLKREGENNHER